MAAKAKQVEVWRGRWFVGVDWSMRGFIGHAWLSLRRPFAAIWLGRL
jgi:hypothetical protein